MMRRNWIHLPIAAFWILVLSFPARAELGEFWKMFHPLAGVQEEYTDNLNLTPENPKEDYITRGYVGLRFSTLPASPTTPGLIQQTPEGPSGLDLDYRLGYVAYARNHDRNYVSHEGRLNAWHAFDPRWSVRLRDYFIRSDEPREREYIVEAAPDQYVLATRQERFIYYRNVLEPSIHYRFGPENSLSLLYRNNLYENENPTVSDSVENYISPSLVYWFSARHGIRLEYGFTYGDFDNSPDLRGHMGRGRYSYRFGPQSSVFFEYTYLYRDFQDPGTDYQVHNPTLGIEYAFTPSLLATLQGGYYRYQPKEGSSEDGFSVNASLTQRWARTQFTLAVDGGFREDYFTSENLGFVKYYRGRAGISHQPLQRLNLGLSGSVERAEYPSSDRKDWIWRVGGSATYGIFRWLNLSLEAFHRANDSNVPSVEYEENRVILSLGIIL